MPPSPVCVPPMVYFDCRNATPGATGAGCQKSCHTLDMDCVSAPGIPPAPTPLWSSSLRPTWGTPVRGLLTHHPWGPWQPRPSCRCRGLLSRHPRPQYSSQCVPGCVCPSGLVASGEGGCIPASDCPCVHNEASYPAGQTIRVGCNTWYEGGEGPLQREGQPSPRGPLHPPAGPWRP